MHLVRERFGWQKLYTIHRLDRETSGVVLFAKTHQKAQHMAALFRHGAVIASKTNLHFISLRELRPRG